MTTPLLRFVLVPLIALSGWLSAGEGADAGKSPPVAAPQPPTASDLPQASVAMLKEKLPAVPSLVERDGALWWDDGKGAAVKVVGTNNLGNAQVETATGVIIVARKLIADGRLDALALLPRLAAHAKAAALTLDGFELAEGIMTGLHLHNRDDIKVLAEGVVRRTAAVVADRRPEIERLNAARGRCVQAAAKTGLDALGRKAFDDVLERLPLGDSDRPFEFDEVRPTFARRLVRQGWLDQALKGQAAGLDTQVAADVRQAVTEVDGLKPTTVFEGSGLRLAEMRNAFSQGGWVLTTPTRSAYARALPAPMYAEGVPGAPLNLVVDLPAGVDPLVDAGRATAARIYHVTAQGTQLLARWSADAGFAADLVDWRKAVPERGRGIGRDTTRGFLPPHLLLVGMNGDIRSLITAHGVVSPPKDASDKEAERFFAEAAKALPDAPHLDLVGEHLFYYVYDSPDSRYPFLIGNKNVKGDIHQTAYQTLDTVTGGMFRGDCDDLSELYQTITERQGRIAHVVSLPRHAALAFAEKKDAGWHTYILQTGQPLEFTADSLAESLKLAYLSFNEADNFDANGLGLLLRFSGENTRSSWRLSWRIFADADYARTMIDVQKDWHFQTYQRGITKMLALIAKGDTDTANYRELSGLYGFTGQYDLSVDYHRKALDATEDPESKLNATAELVMHLQEAKRHDQARTVALGMLDKQVPALRKQLGARSIQIGLELAGILAKGKSQDLALRALKELVFDPAGENSLPSQIGQLAELLDGKQLSKQRWEQLDQLRNLMQMYVGTALLIVEEIGPKGQPGDDTLRLVTRSVQDWLNGVGFHDIDEPEEILWRYATAGQFYGAVLGHDRLITMLEGVELPTKADTAHARRVGGLAQVGIDLPWIKLSVPFWFARLGELFEKERTTLDKEKALRFGRQLAQSAAACQRLGLESNFLTHQTHLAALITALVAQDEPALRERLRYVKEKDDKRLRDDTAQWLGDCARFLPLDWYQTVIKAWKDELNYKPKYFWIAWRAALSGGAQHALLVAKAAAQEFIDDPSFTEEYQFMKKLLEPGKAEKPAAPPAEARPKKEAAVTP